MTHNQIGFNYFLIKEEYTISTITKSKINNALTVPNHSIGSKYSDASSIIIFMLNIKNANDKISTLGFLDNLKDISVRMNNKKQMPIIQISR